MSLSSFLTVTHLLGLALGLGAATVKSMLLIRAGHDPGRLAAYLEVSEPITRPIVLGLALLTLSGIGWLLLGTRVTPVLGVKVGLVLALWVIGPLIDKVVEPRFRRFAPAVGEAESPSFVRARRQMVAIELVATLVFYVVVVLWVLA